MHKHKHKHKQILISLAATAVLGSGTLLAGPADDAVEYRQGLMEVYGWNMGAMGAMAKGKVPFDSAVFKRHADDLATASKLSFLSAFPEDSVSEESDAMDEIWLRFDEFEQKHKDFQAAAAKLAETAAGGDEAAMKAAAGDMGKSCKACHKEFKK